MIFNETSLAHDVNFKDDHEQTIKKINDEFDYYKNLRIDNFSENFPYEEYLQKIIDFITKQNNLLNVSNKINI